MRTDKPEHLKTFDYLGLHHYFLTFCTHDRRNFKASFGQQLWQRYGFERTLRRDEAALSVARYIVENPVRAGLAERVTDYPFLGSDVYTIEEILDALQLQQGWCHRSG